MSNVAPKWFEKAIANKPEVLSVKIKGTKISYNAWGDKSKPGLIFLFMVAWRMQSGGVLSLPTLQKTHRVAAMNLGGMGDSEWKKNIQLSLGAQK